MGIYNSIFRHISMSDVKKNALKIQELDRADELREHQQKILADMYRYDWRSQLNEKMTTAGMSMSVFDAEGDVDLSTNDVGASASYSQSSNAQFSGSQATFNFSGSASVGQTYLRQGFFNQIDATKFDSFVTRVTVGSGPSSWNEPRVGTPTHSFSGGFRVVMYSKSQEGNPLSYSSTELSTGTNTITIPSNKRVSDLVIYYTGYANKDSLQTGGVTGNHIVHSASFQRRSPMNLLVSLDDPEANSFIRGGLGGSEERKAKLKDMLEAGNELMIKLGLEPSKTSPGDIELAQHMPTSADDYTSDEDPVKDDDFPDDPFDDSDFPDLDLAMNQGPSTPVKLDIDGRLVPNQGGGRPGKIRLKGKAKLA